MALEGGGENEEVLDKTPEGGADKHFHAPYSVESKMTSFPSMCFPSSTYVCMLFNIKLCYECPCGSRLLV